MMTWRIENYKTKDDNDPVEEWLSGLPDKKLVSVLRSKITSLSKNGFQLLQTKAMKHIGGEDENLYELIGGAGRITVYFDQARRVFILINAFRKTRKKQTDKISEARRYLHDYLDR